MMKPEQGFKLLAAAKPWLWLNPAYSGTLPATPSLEDIQSADARLRRFAPLLSRLFPELAPSGGIIESPLIEAEPLVKELCRCSGKGLKLYLKADHQLPVAGSVKARGGIYEVLCVAEALATEAGLIGPGSDYACLGDPDARALFADHQIAVGSTGNLGLSIGIMAAALGFNVVVHMSKEAKAWKKQRLRDAGVEVVEHGGDYSRAVALGRAQSEADPNSYFVDDEKSLPLFMGYAVAALRLVAQLRQAGIQPSAKQPLLVYLPCGVGGAPGGICYGLKRVLGNHVHCFFAEPVQAPCMLYGLLGGQARPVSELGLSLPTEADGLAVGQASELVMQLIGGVLAGIYTVTDRELYLNLERLYRQMGLFIEPSAAAGFSGPGWMLETEAGGAFARRQGFDPTQAYHLLWTTGGSLVPAQEREALLKRGAQYL